MLGWNTPGSTQVPPRSHPESLEQTSKVDPIRHLVHSRTQFSANPIFSSRKKAGVMAMFEMMHPMRCQQFTSIYCCDSSFWRTRPTCPTNHLQGSTNKVHHCQTGPGTTLWWPVIHNQLLHSVLGNHRWINFMMANKQQKGYNSWSMTGQYGWCCSAFGLMVSIGNAITLIR